MQDSETFCLLRFNEIGVVFFLGLSEGATGSRFGSKRFHGVGFIVLYSNYGAHLQMTIP
jgi:hypothetical protein